MKRKVLIRSICTGLAVCVFAGMAMASSSSSRTKETGSGRIPLPYFLLNCVLSSSVITEFAVTCEERT